MKNFMTKLAFAGFGAFLLQSSAFADTQTGIISVVRINTDDFLKTNPVRTSIEMPIRNFCNTNWYAINHADTGLGKLITELALVAHQSNLTVTIQGNGLCDAHGTEGIAFLDLDAQRAIRQAN
jgi:hypothetical protein